MLMDRNETKKIIGIIKSSYPKFDIKPEEMAFTVNVWNEFFKEYEYDIVLKATMTYIATNSSGFAPSIGQIIDCISKITQPLQLNELQAWALVSNALRNSSYHAKEEYDKLPPLVQEAIGSPDNLYFWSQADMKSVETVISSNFQRTYKAIVNRSELNAKLPYDVAQMIAAKADLLQIEGGD